MLNASVLVSLEGTKPEFAWKRIRRSK